jgi:peptide/nickel transport system permease protein
MMIRRFPWTFRVGFAITIFFFAVSIFSLLWLPHDPNLIDVEARMAGVGSGSHWLGTDTLGRDLLSGLMVGARLSLILGCATSALAVVLGTIVAFIAVGSKPIIDELLMRSSDVIMAVPGVIVALVVAATISLSATSTVIVLSIFFSPVIARVVRSAALPIMNEEFVLAARQYGRGTIFILIRHVLPNILSLLVVQFSLYTASAVLAESGLSYLGVGISRPQLSWGTLLKEAQELAGLGSALMLWPAMLIMVFVLGLNLLGDGLRDVLDPKLRQYKASVNDE